MSTDVLPANGERVAPAISGGPRFLNVKQVAEMLAIATSTVYHLIEVGSLPSYPMGTGRGAIRVSLEDLNAYLASRRTGGPSLQAAVSAPKRVKLQTLRPRTSVKRHRKAKATAK